jgi:hypothetical protein
MLANAKYIYALDMWTVEKRTKGWYFSKSAYHGRKHDWRRPYAKRSQRHVDDCGELRREIIRPIGTRRVRRARRKAGMSAAAGVTWIGRGKWAAGPYQAAGKIEWASPR